MRIVNKKCALFVYAKIRFSKNRNFSKFSEEFHQRFEVLQYRRIFHINMENPESLNGSGNQGIRRMPAQKK